MVTYGARPTVKSKKRNLKQRFLLAREIFSIPYKNYFRYEQEVRIFDSYFSRNVVALQLEIENTLDAVKKNINNSFFNNTEKMQIKLSSLQNYFVFQLIECLRKWIYIISSYKLKNLNWQITDSDGCLFNVQLTKYGLMEP